MLNKNVFSDKKDKSNSCIFAMMSQMIEKAVIEIGFETQLFETALKRISIFSTHPFSFICMHKTDNNKRSIKQGAKVNVNSTYITRCVISLCVIY